jgi:FkbH-like protein
LHDTRAAYALLQQLRDTFGKTSIHADDAIRLESIRLSYRNVKSSYRSSTTSPDRFLQEADAVLQLNLQSDNPDSRALELVNKTNQFNLNGRKHTEASWRRLRQAPDAVMMIASYEDKYGPLGKIAVSAGRHVGSTLYIDTWVMSCRAFSRRIEDRCIEELFARLEVSEVVFDYVPTERNEPLRAFLNDLLGEPPTVACRLSRDRFTQTRRPTFHRVEVTYG